MLLPVTKGPCPVYERQGESQRLIGRESDSDRETEAETETKTKTEQRHRKTSREKETNSIPRRRLSVLR